MEDKKAKFRQDTEDLITEQCKEMGVEIQGHVAGGADREGKVIYASVGTMSAIFNILTVLVYDFLQSCDTPVEIFRVQSAFLTLLKDRTSEIIGGPIDEILDEFALRRGEPQAVKEEDLPEEIANALKLIFNKNGGSESIH